MCLINAGYFRVIGEHEPLPLMGANTMYFSDSRGFVLLAAPLAWPLVGLLPLPLGHAGPHSQAVRLDVGNTIAAVHDELPASGRSVEKKRATNCTVVSVFHSQGNRGPRLAWALSHSVRMPSLPSSCFSRRDAMGSPGHPSAAHDRTAEHGEVRTGTGRAGLRCCAAIGWRLPHSRPVAASAALQLVRASLAVLLVLRPGQSYAPRTTQPWRRARTLWCAPAVLRPCGGARPVPRSLPPSSVASQAGPGQVSPACARRLRTALSVLPVVRVELAATAAMRHRRPQSTPSSVLDKCWR